MGIRDYFYMWQPGPRTLFTPPLSLSLNSPQFGLSEIAHLRIRPETAGFGFPPPAEFEDADERLLGVRQNRDSVSNPRGCPPPISRLVGAPRLSVCRNV